MRTQVWWRLALVAAGLGLVTVPLCGAQSPATQATAGGSAGGTLPRLDHIDVMAVDSSVSPCANFYQYTCGKLNAASPIPPDQVMWGASGKLQQWNRLVLREILEQAATPGATRTPNQQKIGDFYTSCMDQNAVGAAALAPIAPLLARIDGMRSVADLAGVLAELHRSFGEAWGSDNNQVRVAVFGFGPTPDFDDASRVVAGLDQGGLGLPSRDFYLKQDERSKAVREHYVAYIAKLLAMDGATEATAQSEASSVLAFETTLAKAQMDNVTRRDPAKVNNRMTLAQVKALTPSFQWDVYLEAVHAPAVPLYEVATPDFFRELQRQMAGVDLATWKTYLRWQLLNAAAPYLGRSWREANFDFRGRTLFGVKEMPPDWRRCTSAVDQNLGEALGEVYVQKVFPPESKARAKELVEGIEAAMSRDIEQVSWMQPQTKQEAQRKLSAIVEKIGYPDHWRDYSSLRVTRTGYAGNVERATAFESERQMRKIGRPLDRTEWLMTPPTVDAYEDPQSNTINFPAGILQPIFFDPAEDDVINYGSEGAVMGHELTHGFDDQGRKFDERGNLRDWWTPTDTKNYDERGSCVAKEYTGAVPGVAGVQQDGRLTQGEDTADNGGLYLALSALQADLKKQGKTLGDRDANGLTNLQRFFLAYGNSWCEQIRPQAARTFVLSNPHSMPELRVNNVVGNMPEFEEAFGCKAGQPMVHATECRVW